MNTRAAGLWLSAWLVTVPAVLPATAAGNAAADGAVATANEGSGAQDGGAAYPASDVARAPARAEEEDAKEGPGHTARARYNAGLELLRSGDHEAAAEAFLAARDTAGPDPELRYRAAFNLGLALALGAGIGTGAGAGAAASGSGSGTRTGAGAGDAAADAHAGDAGSADAGEPALAALRQSAAWFADAVRLAPPGDDDARVNLELVSRRILELADRLRGADRLEERLDRLIDDQRGVRDAVRRLLAAVDSEGARAAPIGFRDAFDDLASRERTLVAEVGDSIEAAAEERLSIERAPEDERTPEQRLRAWQLAALGAELERARQSLGEARRRLRRLEGERGHRRADAALADLKRARERLLNPVAVLGSVARDQAELIAHAAALASPPEGAGQSGGPPPGWLTNEHLAERQEDGAGRAGEVLAHFDAVLSTAADPAGEAPDREAERTLRAAAAAVPILERAVSAMREAAGALRAERPAGAASAGREALAGLRQAIELFAGVKHLVELAWADQRRIVELLAEDPGDARSGAARGEAVRALAADNERRLDRLEGVLEAERAGALAARAKDGENAPGEGPGRDPGKVEAEAERYRQAESLRARALAGVRELKIALAGAAEGGSADESEARGAADESFTALDELRRLFFSVVEHLAALRDDQAETRDRTATAQFERFANTDALATELALAARRQQGHERLAAALAGALAEQADAAGEAEPGAGAAAGPEAMERLAGAAGEVREAVARMHGAGALLADAASRAASPMLEPALEDQMAALEHLENALAALASSTEAGDRRSSGEDRPPGEAGPQSAQPGGERPDGEGPLSRREALKRLQAIRDREAERQRARAPDGHEPVEKDW